MKLLHGKVLDYGKAESYNKQYEVQMESKKYD